MELAHSSYYYQPRGGSAEKRQADADVRDRIEEIALRFPRYGYRRMTRQLQREGFPEEELEITAWTESGVIMGVRHRLYAIEGVQFHPESIMTDVGKDILRNFLEI